MEPKPRVTWEEDTHGRLFLVPPFETRWPDYTIVVIRKGMKNVFYEVLGDYWSDYPDTIYSGGNLDEAKRAGEKHWFHEYVNR